MPLQTDNSIQDINILNFVNMKMRARAQIVDDHKNYLPTKPDRHLDQL